MSNLDTLNFFLLCFIILNIPLFLATFSLNVFGQETKAPPAVTPTPVNTPTPTAPNPNLQYLPQKAYVQAYAPENGIPANQQPLQVVPQVVPAPVQTQSVGGFDVGSILSMAIAAGSGLMAKMGFDKAKKVQGTVQDVAQVQVKQTDQTKVLAKQVYENMPDKGNSITDKPEIQLKTLEETKDQAVETATKS